MRIDYSGIKNNKISLFLSLVSFLRFQDKQQLFLVKYKFQSKMWYDNSFPEDAPEKLYPSRIWS